MTTDHTTSGPRSARHELFAVYGAELIGTFVLVFGITVAVTFAMSAPGVYVPLIGALVNGLVLAAAIAATGHVSGAHLNPAVSVGMAVIGRFPWRRVPGYVIAQLVGAVLAAAATWAIGGAHARVVGHLGATSLSAGVGPWRGVFTEALVTFILVLVVTAVATDDRVSAAITPFAVGAALATGVLIAGPVDGAAVNPARALGPMIVAGTLADWWVFLLGPLVGGVLAAVLYDRVLRPRTATHAGRAERDMTVPEDTVSPAS